MPWPMSRLQMVTSAEGCPLTYQVKAGMLPGQRAANEASLIGQSTNGWPGLKANSPEQIVVYERMDPCGLMMH